MHSTTALLIPSMVLATLHTIGILAVMREDKRSETFDIVMLAVYTVAFSGCLTVILRGTP